MAELGYALSGIGTGLQQSVGSLRQTAEDLRKESQFEQYQRPALDLNNQQVQEELKLRGTKVTKDEAISSHPFGQQMWDYGVATGKIDPKTNVITAADKRDISKDIYENNPQLFHSWIQQKSAQAQSQSDLMKSSIAKSQEDMASVQKEIDEAKAEGTAQSIDAIQKKLMPKLQKLQGEAASYQKQMAAADEQQKALHTQGQVVQNYMENKFIASLPKEDQKYAQLARERNLPVTAESVESLKRESATLKKEETATDHYTVKNKKTGEIKSLRLKPGEMIPKGWEITSTGGAEAMQFTPEALDALSKRFAATGEIPGMGMGKAATEARTKVINKWADDLKKTAQTPEEQLAQQASYKASVGELKKLQSQRGTVMAFATTADKNIQIAKKLSDKVNRTGSPAINRWLLAGKRTLAGDPDVAAFDAAMRTAINEYAKVTSSATGGGVTSDSARKEVESMLNVAQSPEQVKAVIGVLEQEIGNRKSGYDEQIKTIQDAIANKGKAPTATDTTGTIKGAHGEY